MSLLIEPVKSDEVPLLVDVSRKTFFDTFYAQNSKEDIELFLESTFSYEVLKRELSETYNNFFFAKLDDEIAGYLKLSTETSSLFEDEDVLEIARIYVVKERLGTGVGKAFIEFAISFAKQLQKKVVFLGVWEHNLRAIAFYESFGFEKFSEHTFMVGNDPQNDWLMKVEVA